MTNNFNYQVSNKDINNNSSSSSRNNEIKYNNNNSGADGSGGKKNRNNRKNYYDSNNDNSNYNDYDSNNDDNNDKTVIFNKDTSQQNDAVTNKSVLTLQHPSRIADNTPYGNKKISSSEYLCNENTDNSESPYKTKSSSNFNSNSNILLHKDVEEKVFSNTAGGTLSRRTSFSDNQNLEIPKKNSEKSHLVPDSRSKDSSSFSSKSNQINGHDDDNSDNIHEQERRHEEDNSVLGISTKSVKRNNSGRNISSDINEAGNGVNGRNEHSVSKRYTDKMINNEREKKDENQKDGGRKIEKESQKDLRNNEIKVDNVLSSNISYHDRSKNIENDNIDGNNKSKHGDNSDMYDDSNNINYRNDNNSGSSKSSRSSKSNDHNNINISIDNNNDSSNNDGINGSNKSNKSGNSNHSDNHELHNNDNTNHSAAANQQNNATSSSREESSASKKIVPRRNSSICSASLSNISPEIHLSLSPPISDTSAVISSSTH